MIRSNLVEKINEYGDVVINIHDYIDARLNGEDLECVFITDDKEFELLENSKMTFNYDEPTLFTQKEYKTSSEDYLQTLSKEWNIPTKYFQIDLVEFFISKCNSDNEKIRVAMELDEFIKRKQLNVLYSMIYLVDLMRENGVVWGIGRGSSVASFCLYLIGINKINPLKYDIDHTEFFK